MQWPPSATTATGVVVDTPDVLLVTRKAAGQQVKDILEQVERSWPGKHD